MEDNYNSSILADRKVSFVGLSSEPSDFAVEFLVDRLDSENISATKLRLQPCLICFEGCLTQVDVKQFC